MSLFRSQLVAAKLLLLHNASSMQHNISLSQKKLLSKVHYQSSGNTDLALLSTNTSKADKGKIPLVCGTGIYRCLKIKAKSSGFNLK